MADVVALRMTDGMAPRSTYHGMQSRYLGDGTLAEVAGLAGDLVQPLDALLRRRVGAEQRREVDLALQRGDAHRPHGDAVGPPVQFLATGGPQAAV